MTWKEKIRGLISSTKKAKWLEWWNISRTQIAYPNLVQGFQHTLRIASLILSSLSVSVKMAAMAIRNSAKLIFPSPSPSQFRIRSWISSSDTSSPKLQEKSFALNFWFNLNIVGSVSLEHQLLLSLISWSLGHLSIQETGKLVRYKYVLLEKRLFVRKTILRNHIRCTYFKTGCTRWNRHHCLTDCRAFLS